MDRRVVAFTLAAALTAAAPAAAVSIRSRDVVTSGALASYPVRVVALSDGGHVAAWYEVPATAIVGRVRARIYHPSGEAKQDLLCSAASTSTKPALVALAGNTFMLGCDEFFGVPWTRPRLQRFDGDGHPLGDPIFIEGTVTAELRNLFRGTRGAAIVSATRCGNRDCDSINEVRSRNGDRLGAFRTLKFERVFPLRDDALLQIGVYDDPVTRTTLVARKRTGDGRRLGHEIKLADGISYPGPAVRGHEGIVAASWPTGAGGIAVQLFDRDGTRLGRRQKIRVGHRREAVLSPVVVPLPEGLLLLWSAFNQQRLLAQYATRTGELIGTPIELDDRFQIIDSAEYVSADRSVILGLSTDTSSPDEQTVLRLDTVR